MRSVYASVLATFTLGFIVQSHMGFRMITPSIAISPAQSWGIWISCFLAFVLIGMIAAGVAKQNQKKILVYFPCIGLIFSLIVAKPLVYLKKENSYFPSATTKTETKIFKVNRIFKIDGKYPRGFVEIDDLRIKIEIFPEDYFDITGLRVRDLLAPPEYNRDDLCAELTVQTNGTSLRVMTTSDGSLPKHSVRLCK